MKPITLNNHKIIKEEHNGRFAGEMTRYTCKKCGKTDWNTITWFEKNKCKGSKIKKYIYDGLKN